MSERDFDEWLSKFKPSISNYKYYVDFNKVVENADRYKHELHLMNSLIGSKDIENDFLKLASKYPTVLNCIPTLIAVRSNEILVLDNSVLFEYAFDKPNYTLDQYAIFLREVGLFDMISNHFVNNLYDYVLGVETGLDSNARKNRGGHLMEDLVENYIKETGFTYYKEMYSEEIEKKWKLDLSKLTHTGTSHKRFDFVIDSGKCIYGIEVNFYTSSGSKLNETARSYEKLTESAKNIEGFKFVWITDGIGWRNAKGNLKETFSILEHIYCLEELEQGILKKL